MWWALWGTGKAKSVINCYQGASPPVGEIMNVSGSDDKVFQEGR